MTIRINVNTGAAAAEADEVLRKAAQRMQWRQMVLEWFIAWLLVTLVAGLPVWAIVEWVWPWLGPKLFVPCPLPTTAGKTFIIAYCVASGWSRVVGMLLKDRKAKRIARGTYSGHG